jgi:hypothetical protein
MEVKSKSARIPPKKKTKYLCLLEKMGRTVFMDNVHALNVYRAHCILCNREFSITHAVIATADGILAQNKINKRRGM